MLTGIGEVKMTRIYMLQWTVWGQINKITEQHSNLEPSTWCYSLVVLKSRFDLGGRRADKELWIKTVVKFNHAWNNKRTITHCKNVSSLWNKLQMRLYVSNNYNLRCHSRSKLQTNQNLTHIQCVVYNAL